MPTSSGGAEGVLAGSFNPHCARVDPARLARGLAAACERLGVKIYEQSPAEHLGPKVVQCRNGRVSADVVVRATESYTIRERAERRSFLPLYSLMIATEPLPQQTWDELGWRDGLGVADFRHLYYYAQRTIDGRIALGGRGAPYRLTNPISPQNEQDAGVFQRLCETLREAFPAAAQARITHHWGGSLAVPRDWCMRTTFDRKTGLGFVGAFGGHGVTAANISGRTMRDLILGHSTDLTSLPWVGHHTRNWEPEPIRFIASRLIAKTLEPPMPTRSAPASRPSAPGWSSRSCHRASRRRGESNAGLGRAPSHVRPVRRPVLGYRPALARRRRQPARAQCDARDQPRADRHRRTVAVAIPGGDPGDRQHRVSLGEGWTPMLPVGRGPGDGCTSSSSGSTRRRASRTAAWR